MKTIIERQLSLDVKYILIDKKYIPLTEGYGYTCDNCGKLIANIATVKNTEGKSFNIGFDCLETILINNSLLSTNDIKEYELAKAMIPKIIRFSKTIKEQVSNCKTITGIRFEKQTYTSDWFTYYWLQNNKTTGGYNDSVKLKDMNFDFLIETIKYIFPRLNIIVE